MKRRTVIIASILILLSAGLFVPFAGQSVIGFRYSVFVDNLAEVCPNHVVSVDGLVVVLDDGRSVELEALSAAWLLTKIKHEEGDGRVRFDEDPLRPGAGMLHMPRLIGLSGTDRPESRQLLTVPVLKKVFRKYTSMPVGAARDITPRT